jgi:hypothetical protein
MTRFLVRCGLTPPLVTHLMDQLPDPASYAHIRPADLEHEGVPFWVGARVLAALEIASSRRECVASLGSLQGHGDEAEQQRGGDVSRVFEWDAVSVGRYFEAGGAVEAAGVARQEGIVGYVLSQIDGNGMLVRREDVTDRLVPSKKLKEKAVVRGLLSRGETTSMRWTAPLTTI